MLLRPALAKEFFDAQELEQSRTFWHKNLNKGRLRKEIDDFIISLGLGGMVDQLAQYRAQERLIAMSAKHTTFISGYMAFFRALDSEESEVGPFGGKSDLSNRTVVYALYVLVERLVLSPKFPLALVRKRRKLWKHPQINNVLRHIEYGPAILVRLIDEYKIFRPDAGSA